MLKALPPKPKFYIGIDCGVDTGFAVWKMETRRLIVVSTLMIHQGLDETRLWRESADGNIFVRVEDARKRTWFGISGPERWKGAGSICRDSKIWEEFLKDENIPHEMVAPKNNRTKLKSEQFLVFTGWKDRTSEHSRDAAMLVYGY